MYLLNRSEMPEAVTFDGAKYNRDYTADPPPDPTMTVTPHDFQIDGEVEAEAGSTLADDDDAKQAKAQMMLQTSMQNPHLNQRTATIEWLIANGKGKDIGKWLNPPPPPPPPPPPSEPMRESFAITAKLELMPQEVQSAVLAKAGFTPAPPAPPPGPAGPGGPPPGPPPPQGPGGTVPAPPPEPGDALPVGPAVLAAEGRHAPVGHP
jgi:hypothetical protein